MKLLREYQVLEYTKEQLLEAKEKNGGKYLLRGILQKADTLNQNGRIYPRDILEREIRNYQKLILENRALGECDHPDSSVISLKNVSHVIREAYLENNVVYGTVELLNTPSGKILQSLVESGIKLGISSRGIGTTSREGSYDVVQSDYMLICLDIVSEPSTPGAFLMKEGREISINEFNDCKKIFNKSDRIDRIANDILFSTKL